MLYLVGSSNGRINVDLLDARRRIIVALDTPDVDSAQALVTRLSDTAGIYKVGLELVSSRGGMKFARSLVEAGRSVFLDMKLLDIPNTVERAVANVARMQVDFLTVHGHDRKTLDAAVRGREQDPRTTHRRLKLLSVTVLTSLDAADLAEQGIAGRAPLDLVVHRARLAHAAGFDGVVASGHEIEAIRKATDPRFLIVVPGIRPAAAAVGDQARVATPAEAVRRGASYLVIGRPITQAADPAAAAAAIADEIARAT